MPGVVCCLLCFLAATFLILREEEVKEEREGGEAENTEEVNVLGVVLLVLAGWGIRQRSQVFFT